MTSFEPTATATAAAIPAGDRISVEWIVGKWTDLFCFIGAAALGYAMFFLHAGLRFNMVTVWFVWYMMLDSPHFFGTYSRTYLDREEWAGRRKLLIGSLFLLLVGPACVAAGYVLHEAGASWYKTPYIALVAFVSIWAYWHVVRQHYGIMSLYKRKNRDGELFDRRLDQVVLYTGLLAPFIAFAVTNNEARVALGLSAVSDGHFSSPYVSGGWEQIVVQVTFSLAGLALLTGAARQLIRWQRGSILNVPKLLFLLAVIPLHMVVCYHPQSTTLALLGFSACVTIFHDVQYHAIVWYYQKNRMAKAGEARYEKYGLASRVSRSFPVYMLWAVAMGVGLGLLGCLVDVNPGCFPTNIPLIASRSTPLFGVPGNEITLNELLYGVFLGVLMHHYFVDQFIWRPSKDASVQKNLKV